MDRGTKLVWETFMSTFLRLTLTIVGVRPVALFRVMWKEKQSRRLPCIKYRASHIRQAVGSRILSFKHDNSVHTVGEERQFADK